DNWPLLLCAGEIDCMSAMLQGYHAVTTTGGETAWRREFTPLFSGKEVVVVYDGDVTGRTQGRKRAYDLVGTARVVKLAQLPDGEDINSLWQQGIRLDQFIEKAIVVSTSGPRLLTGPALLAEAEEELKKPWLIEGLFRPGWFVVFGGHGKAGRTTLAVHMMYALLQGEPFLDRRTAKSPVIYVSYEMPLEELVRLYQDVAGEDPTKWPVSLIDPPQPLTPDNLRQYINSEQKGVIVIDSATPALALRKDEENQGGEVGHRLRLFQQFARTSGWTVVMIHHLKKTGGGYMDLSGSREWIAAPDLLMTWSLDENGEKEDGMKKGTLEVIGRVPDIEPQILYLGRNKVRIAGSQTDMMVQEIVDVLLVNPGMTVEELTRTVQLPRRELLTLLAENQHRFIRKGNGERGNPFKWYVRATDSWEDVSTIGGRN